MGKKNDDVLLEYPDLRDLDLPKYDEGRVVAWMEELVALQGAEKQIKDLKENILKAVGGGVEFRVGKSAWGSRWQEGRRSFMREKAIEAGITPDQIEASMTTSDGHWVREFSQLKEEG